METEVQVQPPMGPSGTWAQDEGGKGGANGSRTRQKKQTCGAGCRYNPRRVAGGGWQVWAKSRWMRYHAERGGEERVLRKERDAMKNATEWGR